MKLEHNWDHAIISEHLLKIFRREEDDLLLQAAADATHRWELRFILDYDNINEGTSGIGGTVSYNKKKRKFTFIEYSDRRNWAVRFSIASGAHYSAWEFRNFLYHNVPQAYYPTKKLSQWLLTH